MNIRGLRPLSLASLVLLVAAPCAWGQRLSVDASNRTAVADFYHNYYCSGEKASADWSGDIAAGDAGTTSTAYHQATLDRINFFRAMAGIPAGIIFRDDWSAKCRQAALMMSANNTLSHDPAADWLHYTQQGAEAAGRSNLSLGNAGPASITGQLRDNGDNNFYVGHRRWLLYPPAVEMGHGSVVPAAAYRAASAIWVIQSNPNHSVPRDVPAMWPPEGYVPQGLIFERWSFSYPAADFSGAGVAVTRDGTAVAVTLEALHNGAGDNSIVWRLVPAAAAGAEAAFTVTVSNVALSSGTVRSFSYTVRQFDPDPPLADSKVMGRIAAVESGSYPLRIWVEDVYGCQPSAPLTLELLWAPLGSQEPPRVIGEAAGPAVNWRLGGPGEYTVRIKGTNLVSGVFTANPDGTVSNPSSDGGGGAAQRIASISVTRKGAKKILITAIARTISGGGVSAGLSLLVGTKSGGSDRAHYAVVTTDQSGEVTAALMWKNLLKTARTLVQKNKRKRLKKIFIWVCTEDQTVCSARVRLG